MRFFDIVIFPHQDDQPDQSERQIDKKDRTPAEEFNEIRPHAGPASAAQPQTALNNP